MTLVYYNFTIMVILACNKFDIKRSLYSFNKDSITKIDACRSIDNYTMVNVKIFGHVAIVKDINPMIKMIRKVKIFHLDTEPKIEAFNQYLRYL